MDQKEISNPGEALNSLPFIGANRFITQVAAGGDHRRGKLRQQQVVKRSVREHDPEARIAGRDGWGY